ncbi:MAG: hypothetical protein ACRDRU_20250 [Pseudonocardiaceae bacterium]
MTTCRHCGSHWLSAEDVGRVLNPHQPLTAASARREMSRAGITEQRGYPANRVAGYAAGRPGKGRHNHT